MVLDRPHLHIIGKLIIACRRQLYPDYSTLTVLHLYSLITCKILCFFLSSAGLESLVAVQTDGDGKPWETMILSLAVMHPSVFCLPLPWYLHHSGLLLVFFQHLGYPIGFSKSDM
jgi:hypothetical protein